MQDRQVTGLPYIWKSKQVVEEEDADFSSSAANIFWPRLVSGASRIAKTWRYTWKFDGLTAHVPCLSESAEGKQWLRAQTGQARTAASVP